MTREKLESLLNMPYDRIKRLCRDPEDLLLLGAFSVVYQRGFQEGQHQTHLSTNVLLRGYNTIPSRN